MPVETWQIGGGTALHSATAGRTVAYEATGGQQGVAQPAHMAVRATEVNGPQVRVAPGVVKIESTFRNQFGEMYVDRLYSETTVDIAATGSAGGRSDLVLWEIKDPHATGSIWQEADIADPQNGPYGMLTVEAGVPSTTTSFDELGLSGRTAYALARVDIPASTSTITPGMIVNLRGLSQPKDGQEPYEITKTISVDDPIDSTATSFVPWPDEATWDVPIPPWATHVKLTLTASGALERIGDFVGDIRAAVVNVGATASFPFATIWPGSTIRGTLGPFVFDYAIGTGLRGTTQTVRVEGRHRLGTGEVAVDADSTFTLKAYFTQTVE